jgi:phosphoribosylformylglycinamidine synthase I
MHAAVIVFPGSNCDRDVAAALERATGRPAAMIWHGDDALPPVDLVVIPGGFSYGDYLRSGAIAARSPIMQSVRARAAAGVAILGICNGFQVLTEAGLLPGVLLRNAGLRFVCRDVFLRVETAASPFTRAFRPGAVIRLPIAHNEGNYFADTEALERLFGDGRVAFRYCHADGSVDDGANPNGAARNIAGIFNETRTVLGMMPHPERLADPLLGGEDGRPLFDGLITALGG